MSDDNNVQVSIGAKIDELVQGFNKGGEVVEASVKEMAASVRQSGEVVERSCNEMTAAMQRTQREAKDTSSSVMSSFSGIGGFLTGFLGGIVANFSLQEVIGAVLDFADTAEALGNTAQIIGTTSTELSRLHQTAIPMGIAAESVDKSMVKLAKTLTDARRGGEESAAAFEAVGITGKELQDLTLPEVMAKIADKFKDTEDGASKAALAQMLLGKSGSELIPWLNQGSEAMREQADEAERMGAVMGEDAVAAGEALDAAWDKLGIQGQGLKNLMAQSLAPMLQFIAECFTESSGTAADFGVVFKGVATVVIVAVGVIRTAWNVVSSLVRAITYSISSILDAIVKTVTMDWTGAKAALQTGDAMIRSELSNMIDNQEELGKRFSASMSGMWGDAKPKSTDMEAEGPKGQIDFKPKGGDGKGADGAKAAAKAAADAAREKFEYEMELMRNELAAAEKGAIEKIAIAQRMTDAIKERFGEESREYARAQREQVRIVEEVEAEKRRIKDAGLTIARDAALFEINLAREKANMLIATGELSGVQVVELERRTQEQIYAMQLSYLESRRMLMATEPQEVERINAEIEKLRQEHLIRMAQGDVATFEANKAQWDTYFQSITDGFANAIQGMIFQGTTLREAMGNILQGILGQLIQTGVKMVANWISTQLAMTSATVVGAGVRTAAEVTSAKTSTMANAGAAIKNIMTKAVEVFANVYNAIAGIPYVGPFLAPVMAVAAGATIVGLVGKVASAEGGWDRVPYDGAQAILHKEEMVLPGPLAEGIRQMVEGGGQRNGGVTVYAWDRRDVQRYFGDSAEVFMQTLNQASANAPGGM